MEVTFELRKKERLGLSGGTEVGYGTERAGQVEGTAGTKDLWLEKLEGTA